MQFQKLHGFGLEMPAPGRFWTIVRVKLGSKIGEKLNLKQNALTGMC